MSALAIVISTFGIRRDSSAFRRMSYGMFMGAFTSRARAFRVTEEFNDLGSVIEPHRMDFEAPFLG